LTPKELAELPWCQLSNASGLDKKARQPKTGWQEGHPVCKKWGDDGGWHWLVRMEWRSAGWSVCLPLLIFPCTIKVQKFSSGTGSPGWYRLKGRKTVVVLVV